MSVQDLETAVARLSKEELTQFSQWFEEYVADEWDRQELAGIVASVLGELPNELREVLVLRHYEEMNFEQMSRLLGIPASTLTT